MPRNFARHEQFLRIFALLDVLSNFRQPLDDQALIGLLKERLGLTQLSPRTLRRDCEFLTSCGYAVDHLPLPDGRRFGWALAKDAVNGRPIPAEPLTLLELAAFNVGRDLLKPFGGTVLWTGIESLRHKLDRDAPGAMKSRLDAATRVIHVRDGEQRYASRPRLLSTLVAAIVDCIEIDVETDGRPPATHRLQPHFIVVDPQMLSLLAFPADGAATAPHVLVNLREIQTVTPLDSTFTRRDVRPEELLA